VEDKMRKISIVLMLLAVVIITGCANSQSSSKEEAKYAVERLPDFQELVQYFSVESAGFLLPATKPEIYQSDPKIADRYTIFIHEIIYKTKTGGFKLVLLDDGRPPSIVVTKDIK
jgi:hypothetical protein